MQAIDREILWHQFGATIDMFGEALRDCPDQLWGERLWVEKEMDADSAAFWYVSYLTLFWLDLSRGEEGFAPPEPFTLVELDPAGVPPPRMYTRDELLSCLAYCRRKWQETIGALTPERAYRLCQFGWGELPFVERLLYSLRHVQEHGAQLRLFLGQRAGRSARWVAQAK